MSAQIFLIAISFISILYNGLLSYLSDSWRKKPLPEEVADIYDEERYATFLSRTSDVKRCGLIFTFLNFALDVVILLSPFYAWIDGRFSHNPYLLTCVTFLLIWVISTVIGFFREHYETFTIEEKYGLNKKDMKEFLKDIILNSLLELILLMVLSLVMTFCGEHMSAWTNGFSLKFLPCLLLAAIIFAALWLIIQGIKYISILVLKTQYTFTPMEENELFAKIMSLQADSKKKVRKVYVYNESKKSPRKNAFLLKFLWIREFGIADNFLDENSQDELLGVLSHEIGHLMHKKNFLNYLLYAIPVAAGICFAYLAANPQPIFGINEWVRSSFHLSANNYYLLMSVFLSIGKPLLFLFGVFRTYVTRVEEYEADRKAIQNGYGEALINTFKTLSRDELVNVNPHPVVEWLEYDHPGMYRRIKAMK